MYIPHRNWVYSLLKCPWIYFPLNFEKFFNYEFYSSHKPSLFRTFNVQLYTSNNKIISRFSLNSSPSAPSYHTIFLQINKKKYLFFNMSVGHLFAMKKWFVVVVLVVVVMPLQCVFRVQIRMKWHSMPWRAVVVHHVPVTLSGWFFQCRFNVFFADVVVLALFFLL